MSDCVDQNKCSTIVDAEQRFFAINLCFGISFLSIILSLKTKRIFLNKKNASSFSNKKVKSAQAVVSDLLSPLCDTDVKWHQPNVK